MLKLTSLTLVAVLIVGIFWLGGPSAVRSQETNTYTTGITTACVNTIIKYFNPNMASPTATVYIGKILDMGRNCSWVTDNNAFCNPGSLAPMPTNTAMLVASAFGSNITMMPSCQWTCTGCGTITTGPGDDLPVELMSFGFEDDEEADDPS